jgi:hypothetical protein
MVGSIGTGKTEAYLFPFLQEMIDQKKKLKGVMECSGLIIAPVFIYSYIILSIDITHTHTHARAR